MPVRIQRGNTRPGNLSASAAGSIATLALIALAAGCSQPVDAEFVSSKRDDELYRPVRAQVQQALLDGFGTPQSLVAWMKLPVDFGVAEGSVKSAEDKSNELTVAWSNPETAKAVEKEDLSLAGVVWQTGDYVGTGDPKRKDGGVFVQNYDPQTSQLSLSVNYESAPADGDKFMVVGHNLQRGRVLFMQHCMHCHGVTGDGNGPTAPYLNPKPRDYRLGIFKFTSTRSTDLVRRDDLHRIIRNGIPGTYMPSFLLLKDEELHAITEYVRWLSMRGQVENGLVSSQYDDYSPAGVKAALEGGKTRSDLDAAVKSDEFKEAFDKRLDSIIGGGRGIVKQWNSAEEASAVVHPKTSRTDPDVESIKRGRKLFESPKAKCVSCHGSAGRGDGPQTTDYQKKPDGSEYSEPGLFDVWGNPVKPRDLATGIYRGGRRPVDIYRRMYAGIKGTPMPPFDTVLTEPEIWDLVNYVMSVPYDGKAPPLIKSGTVAETASHSTGK